MLAVVEVVFSGDSGSASFVLPSPVHHIVLTTVCRIQLHWLKAILFLQRRAGPFPQATHLSLPREFAAILCDGHRVPVFEAHVRLFKVHEELGGIWTSCGAGWWGLLDAFVDQVAAQEVSSTVYERQGQVSCTYPFTAGMVLPNARVASFFFLPSTL